MAVRAGFVGLLLRRERLARDWSQQGLCKGICAVSYLSKIEQGKADPSDEIAALLLERLGIAWHTGETARKAQELAERIFDAFCAMDTENAKRACRELEQHPDYVNSPAMLDLLLLKGVVLHEASPELDSFTSVMDEGQRGLWHLIGNRFEEAYQVLPLPVTCALAGYADYVAGNYVRAQERLERAFHQASEACYPHLMCWCKVILGNCCSDLNQYEPMLRHYRGASRLAEALGDGQTLREIGYNIASTQLQFRRYEEAYGYFSALEDPGVLDLHKLAICCEGLGRREEALAALDRVSSAKESAPDRETALLMCDVVRYRLEHPDYLKDEAYGRLLLDCFERLRRELPQGYAAFHLPWLEEWYAAHRQYKQAWELTKNFPGIRR